MGKSTSSADRAGAPPWEYAFRSNGPATSSKNERVRPAVFRKERPRARCMDKARILVVEDESLLAEDVQERLKNLGYEVAGVAHSGEEALTSLATSPSDLVLMDIRLKGKMDGIDTARVVRDRKSTRLNSSHSQISYAVFCLKKKKKKIEVTMHPDIT